MYHSQSKSSYYFQTQLMKHIIIHTRIFHNNKLEVHALRWCYYSYSCYWSRLHQRLLTATRTYHRSTGLIFVGNWLTGWSLLLLIRENHPTASSLEWVLLLRLGYKYLWCCCGKEEEYWCCDWEEKPLLFFLVESYIVVHNAAVAKLLLWGEANSVAERESYWWRNLCCSRCWKDERCWLLKSSFHC